jgi:DNA methylase
MQGREAWVPLEHLTFDTTIYPREQWKTATVERYVDCLKRGDQFPPLIVEEGTTRLLDGVHRWKAYLKYHDLYQGRVTSPPLVATEYDQQDAWAAPVVQIPVHYHQIPAGIPPKLYAAALSVTHGDRIDTAERKRLAREIYEANPDFRLEDLEAYLHISKSTAGEYVADIRARRKEAQKTIAYRLHLLGWTQEEIAEQVGITRDQYTRGFLCAFPDLEKDTKNLLTSGIPHLDVAERFKLPLILAHAIALQGKGDQERFKRLGITLQPYDVWQFAKCDDLFGMDWPGRIPGQLLAHILYFYTKPGQVILDPMAGSGTTPDVCLAFNRKCYAYDLPKDAQRPDILAHDITAGWPDRLKKADLLFWDPPYFDKKDDLYSAGSISALDHSAYRDFFKSRFAEAYAMVRKDTRLAFLMSDWDDTDGDRPMLGLWHYARLIEDAGWTIIRRIDCPLSTQLVHPDIVEKFRKSRRLARLNRSLLMAERRS